jgi:hypothetical protein
MGSADLPTIVVEEALQQLDGGAGGHNGGQREEEPGKSLMS